MSQTVPQYLFISHRSINIGSTLGYSIRFEKGKPTHVPKPMHATVLEKGCLPCDEKGQIIEAPVAIAGIFDEKAPVLAPEEAEERAEAINKVMRQIVERNAPADFSAGGVPSASAITAALGWKVDQKEVRPLWAKMKPEIVKKPE